MKKVVSASTVVVGLFCGHQAALSATLFQADLTTSQVVFDSLNPTTANAIGLATLVYDDAGPTLSYEIQFIGADANLADTPSAGGDITSVHIHDAPVGTNGPHTLNILGAPGVALGDNDGDVSVDAATNTLTGRWDDGDVAHGPPYTGPETEPLSDHVAALFAGDLYFQVHSVDFPSPDGVLRGQIRLVPEASNIFTVVVVGLLVALRQRRSRRP